MILARDSITLTQMIDISSVTWYYKKQSSISSKPAKPTVADPTSLGWGIEEPTYSEGDSDSLYICQKTTFSDGTFAYSDVSLSSSYEAAKLAYNKADALDGAIGRSVAPYKQVEWVESTGKQFIYLDWKPTMSNWGFDIDFINRNAVNTSAGAWNESTNVNGYGTIFGTRDSSGTNNAQLSSYSNGLLRTYNGTDVLTKYKTDKTRQTLSLRNTTLTFYDGTTATVTRGGGTAKPHAGMTIFGLHQGTRAQSYGNISEPSTTRIYSLKFYDGTALAVDLVPSIRKIDGVTGLYDKVSKHFYPAPGMLYGEDVGVDLGEVESVSDTIVRTNAQTVAVNKAGSRMWEVEVPFDHLEDGQKLAVTYMYSVASSTQTAELPDWNDTTSNQQVYLKLTFSNGSESEWIPCYYSNTGRLTTHYGAGIPILFTYRENITSALSATANSYNIPRGFFADANYDSNTTYTTYSNAVKAGANGVKRYTLLMKDSDDTWTSIVNEANKTGTADKTAYTGGFLISDVVYSSGGAEYAAGANTSTIISGSISTDLRYSCNGLTSGTAAATNLTMFVPVYLVGEVRSDGKFYLNESKWWTQTVPTYEDGKTYIYLGEASSVYQVYLSEQNPAYQFYDGKFRKLSDIETIKAQAAADQAQYDIDHLEIGGRNFLRGTADFNTDGWSPYDMAIDDIIDVDDPPVPGILKSGLSRGSYISLGQNLSLPAGQEYTVSWYARHIDGDMDRRITAYLNLSTVTSVAVDSTSWKHYSVTITPTGNGVTSFTLLAARGDGIIEICGLKLEKGNRATDWTPAPEDVSAEIEAAIDQLEGSLKSQIDAKIETWTQATDPASGWSTAEERAAHNDDLWYYTGTTNATVNSVTIKPSRTYKYNASTNKWLEVTTDLSESLFDRIDGKSTIYYGTPTAPTSTLYADVEDGDYLVDETDGSTYRWDETVIDANKWVKITEIQIGGRNIIRDSTPISVNSFWNVSNATFAKEDGYDCIKFVGALKQTGTAYPTFTMLNESISNKRQLVPTGMTFTFSADVKMVDVVKGTTNYFIALYGGGATINGTWRGPSKITDGEHFTSLTSDNLDPDKLNGNGWTRVWVTHTFSDEYDWPGVSLLLFARDFTGTVFFKNIKIEEGNRATGWSPAPEDVQAAMDTIPNRNFLIATEGNHDSFAVTDGGDGFTQWFHLSDYAKTLLTGNTTDDFTVSFDYDCTNIEGVSGANVQIIHQVNGTSGNADWTTGIVPGSKGHYSCTFKLNATQADAASMDMGVRLRVNLAVEGGYYCFSNLKMELGNKETPWSPAPEDQQYTGIGGINLIKGTGDAFQLDKWFFDKGRDVGNGTIRLVPASAGAYARRLMYNLPYGNYKNQYYTLSFDAKIFNTAEYDTIEPNLLQSTADTVKYTISSGESVYSKYWYFTEAGQTALTGNTTDEITVTFDYQVRGAGAWSTDDEPYLYAQINGTMSNAPFIFIDENGSGHAVCTFKLSAAQASYTDTGFRMRIRMRAANGATMSITHPKIIIGSIDTPWRPMPGDAAYSNTTMPKLIYADPMVVTPERMAYLGVHSSTYDRYGSYTKPLKQDYEWHRYSLTFHAPGGIRSGLADALADSNLFDVEFSLTGGCVPVDIRHIKLEPGIQATPWAQDMEDVESVLSEVKSSLQTQLDGKVLTWAQAEDPAEAWTSVNLKTAHTGDLWYYTGATDKQLLDQSPQLTVKNNSTYKWNGSKWELHKASQDLFDTIDGKRQIFYGSPEGSYGSVDAEDLLIDTDGTTYKWVAPENEDPHWEQTSDIAVGGRNLLRDTANPVGGTTIARSSATYVTAADGVITITPIADAQYAKWKVDYLDYDEYGSGEYTLSCEAMEIDGTSGYTSGGFMFRYGINLASRIDASGLGSTDRYGQFEFTDVSHGTWKKYSTTFKVPDDLTIGATAALVSGSQLTVLLWKRGSTFPIKIRNVKLEKGNRATDWTPAPEDVSSEITSTVDNLKIGSRNLAASSKILPTAASVLASEIIGEGDHLYEIEISAQNQGMYIETSHLTVGEKYVLSYKFKKISGTLSSIGGHCNGFTDVRAYMDGENIGTYHSAKAISDDTNTHSMVVYLKYAGGASDNRLYIQPNRSTTSTGVFDIWDIQLEKGDKATDWTPAPEDTYGMIKDAVEYIEGTQTASTGAWTGVTKDSALYAGKTIAYKLPYAGSGNASLNLTLADGTTTGAKAVYSNTTRVTTHFGANSVITMTYDGSYWRAAGAAPSNSNTYDRTQYKASLTSDSSVNGGAIASGKIAVTNASGKLEVLSTRPFDVTCPILYVGTEYTSGALTQTNNYTMMGAPFNLKTTVSNAPTLVAGKPVYIKGTLSGKTFTPDDGVFTTTTPSTEDGKAYLLFGMMSTATNGVLNAEHPIYRYVNGGFKSTTEIAAEANSAATALYGTCDTAAATAAKVVTCSGFKLFAGAKITVKFTYANSAQIPTLNVNGTGATPIKYANELLSATNQFLWTPGAVIEFAYTGSEWVPVGCPRSYYGESNGAASSATKPTTDANGNQTITGAVVCKGTVLNIKFNYANTAQNPMISIAGIIVKYIVVRGNKIPLNSLYNWQAGSTVEFTFDGSQWVMTVSLSQKEIFNRLTNNGANSGIYSDETTGVFKLYINADYIATGTLAARNGHMSLNMLTGVMTFLSDSNEFLKFDESVLTGGYGNTTDGLLDLSAQYDDNSRNVVIEAKTGDMYLKAGSGKYIYKELNGVLTLAVGSTRHYYGVSNSYGADSSSIDFIRTGTDSSGSYLQITDYSGNSYTADLNFSDKKLKDNITPSTINALAIIEKIKHYAFSFIGTQTMHECGYVAQELEKVIPNAVRDVPQYDQTGNMTGIMKEVIDFEMLGYITKAIQELSEKIDRLEKGAL